MFFLMILLSLAATAALAENTLALPGCQPNCGGVNIPYPFGVGPGCFKDGFEITCKPANSSTGPIPVLAGTDVRVLNLTLRPAEALVQLPIGWQCYNSSGIEAYYSADIYFNSKGVYRFSNTHNQFVVIGCNSLGWIQSQGDSNGVHSYDYYVGCLSYCNDSRSITDDLCDGVGCCEVAIPSGLSDMSIQFSNYKHENILNFSSCDFGFLVDKESFSFSVSNLTMPKTTIMPVWLDWAFREKSTCAEAQRDPTLYACNGKNSQCYDSGNGPGYGCNCSLGYQGNPYIADGCVVLSDTTNGSYPPRSSPSRGISRGALVGSIAGGIAAIIVCLIAWFICKAKRFSSNNQTTSDSVEEYRFELSGANEVITDEVNQTNTQNNNVNNNVVKKPSRPIESSEQSLISNQKRSDSEPGPGLGLSGAGQVQAEEVNQTNTQTNAANRVDVNFCKIL